AIQRGEIPPGPVNCTVAVSSASTHRLNSPVPLTVKLRWKWAVASTMLRERAFGAVMPPSPVLAKLTHCTVPATRPALSLTSPQAEWGEMVWKVPADTRSLLPSPEYSVMRAALAALP